MLDPAVVRANERIKAIANLLFNLGGALLGATAVKLFSAPQLDVAVTIWSIGTVALIWLGHQALGLIEAEQWT